MASIDSLLTAIRAAIPTYTGFSTKKIIPDTYDLSSNPITYLEDSWGLLIGSGSRSEKDIPAIDYRVTTVRSIGVILCRAVYDTHGIGLQVETQVENLLLDSETIIDNFLALSKFGVLKGGEEVIYEGDTGVNRIVDEKLNLIYTQIDFTFEMSRTIN